MSIQNLSFMILSVLLVGCSTAQMAVDKELVSKSNKYEISERPGAFSGKKLIFGPYRATQIDRSALNSSSSGYSVSSMGSFTNNKTGQKYSYHFEGNEKGWISECVVKSGSSEIKRKSSILSGLSYGEGIRVSCNFSTRGNGRNWKFEFKGADLNSAKGSFKVGNKTVRVVPTNKFKGSSLSHGKPTGYYFYVANKLIAGVDVINSKGPVWLEKRLSKKMKDAIAVVAVALLLNQV